MKNRYPYLALIFLTLLNGCSTSKNTQHSDLPILSLENADKIKLGDQAGKDLDALLGPPGYSGKTKSENVLAVLYCDSKPCVQGRITLHVNKTDKTISSIIWTPGSQDKEQNLEYVLNHYQGLTFSKQRLLYSYRDYMDLIETYTNKTQGITISYNPQKKIVTQVVRTNTDPVVISSGFPIVTVLPERDTASSP
jgi:hypothetical protein